MIKNIFRISIFVAVFLLTMASSKIVSDYSFFYQVQILLALASLFLASIFIFLAVKSLLRRLIKNFLLRMLAWAPLMLLCGITFFFLFMAVWNNFEPRFPTDSRDLKIKDGRVYAHFSGGWRDTTTVYYEFPIFSSFYYLKKICLASGHTTSFRLVKEDTVSCEGLGGTKEIEL